MSQNENKPENKQDQANPEVTEQEIKQDSQVELDSPNAEQEQSAVEVVDANIDQEHHATSPSDQQLTPSQVQTAPASSTGWKVATFILAAAVIGLLIYTMIPKSSNNVLAEVNGDKITQQDVMDKLVEYNHTYVADLVEALIDEKVIDQELKAKSITLKDTDLDAEIAAFRLKYPDENDFLSLLSYYGMTEEDLKNNLKQSSQIRLLLSEGITITDEQVQEYFDTNYEQLGAHGERVRASHILVAEEDLAKEIIAQLDQGADFATLAAQYGSDATAQVGGDLGYFERGEMIEEFSTAAFAMELNAYSKEPVASSYGYHVILKTDEQAAYEPTVESLKEAIKTELINTEIYAKHPTYIDELRSKGKVENTFSTLYPAKEGAAPSVQ